MESVYQRKSGSNSRWGPGEVKRHNRAIIPRVHTSRSHIDTFIQDRNRPSQPVPLYVVKGRAAHSPRASGIAKTGKSDFSLVEKCCQPPPPLALSPYGYFPLEKTKQFSHHCLLMFGNARNRLSALGKAMFNSIAKGQYGTIFIFSYLCINNVSTILGTTSLWRVLPVFPAWSDISPERDQTSKRFTLDFRCSVGGVNKEHTDSCEIPRSSLL